MALAMARSRELLEADRAHEAELAAEVEAETERLLAATEALEREAAQRAEAERRLATTERLRFVGDLASSLALELANPLQYVRDALVVVAEARDDLVAAQRALDAWLDGAPDPACARAIRERAERERLALVAEDLDPSIALCHEGVERVTEIVDALKQLSPPGAEDYALVDMGALVQTALTLTRNQFKYVADLDYEASPAPHIPGDASSLQQVLINLIVNAAHAMETGEAAERGRLTVRVREEAGGVAVSIGDTRGGIPDAVRERMFEPFVLHDQGGRPRHRAGARDRPLDRGGAPRRSPAVRHARG